MMRRAKCEITDRQEMTRILASTNIGRLATMGADGYPYITPVNFVFYEGCIYFHSAPKGEKLGNLARDPRVCFEVDVPLAYLKVDFNPEKMTAKSDLGQSRPQQDYRRFIADHPAKRGLPGDLEAVRAMGYKLEGREEIGRGLKE